MYIKNFYYMRIGIYLACLNPEYRGGVNSYAQGLLQGLRNIDSTNQYFLISYGDEKPAYQKYLSENFNFTPLRESRPHPTALKPGIIGSIHKQLRRLRFLVNIVLDTIFFLPFQSKLFAVYCKRKFQSINQQVKLLNLDICYFPVISPELLGLDVKTIVSPHDIQQVHYPENFPFYTRLGRAIEYRSVMDRAAVVQASSVFMKNDFQKNFAIPKEKICIIPEGVMNDFINFIPEAAESEAFLEKYNLKPGYIFYPAQHWPHKNHQTLIKAVALVKEKFGVDLRLVFTGQKDKSFKSLYEFIEKQGYSSFITFTGNLKFKELFYAYYNSLMVVIPGVYESSSLPVKEAMAMGVPVVAAANGSNEEINLDENILLFETFNYQELAEKIYKLYGDRKLRDNLVEKSKAFIKNYTWDKVAQSYVTLFESFKTV